MVNHHFNEARVKLEAAQGELRQLSKPLFDADPDMIDEVALVINDLDNAMTRLDIMQHDLQDRSDA